MTMSCPKTALLDQPEFGRFVFYKLLTAIPVAAALIAMFRYSDALYWPLTYIGLCLLHAGIMYSIKCPHCAYYKKGGKTHHCFMIWGAPKIWKPRSTPESRIVGIYSPIGMLVLTAFPVYWLLSQWELLLVYLLSIAVLVMSFGLHDCPRCLNFECGHNTVPEVVKRAYLESVGAD